MKETLPGRWTLRLPVIVLAVVSFALLLGNELYQARKAEIAAAGHAAETYARLLEGHARSTLEKIDVVLRYVQTSTPQAIARGQSQADIERELRTLLATIPESQSLRIMDARGRPRYDAQGTLHSVSITDRDYYRRHRDDANAGLVISEPIYARITGNWVVTVSRRLNKPDGSFDGLVQAAIRSDYFRDYYRSLDVSNGVIGLYSGDARMIARIPASDQWLGRTPPDAPWPAMLAAGQTRGTFRAGSSIDGIERVWAYRQVGDYPLVVLSGLSVDETLDFWRHKVLFYGAGTLGMSTLLIWLLLGLRRQSAEATSVAQAKANFLARMSHEIRTPLNGILGYCHMLRQRIGEGPERTSLERIDQSANHLLTLINDILDLSKIEAGKFVLERKPLRIGELLDRCLATVSLSAQAKGLTLKAENHFGDRVLLGDPTRILQALLNYCSNAIKFSEHGTITVRARLLEESPTDVRLHFEVEDEGVGIEEANRERLFLAFEQADDSNTRQYGGTGLGLAITRHLAMAMEGETGVFSTLGRGSRFWFSIRLEKAEGPLPEPTAPQTAPISPETFPRKQDGQWSVLLVEDEAINREVMLGFLADYPLQIDCAEDGIEALEKVERQSYDLILMDVQMPRMDGLATTRAIRRLPGHADLPIIAVSANAFTSDRQASLEAGMNDHIAKPVSPDTLYQALARWLPLRNPARPTAAAPTADATLAAIDGLDPAIGLRATQGDADRLRKLLERFVTHYGDLPAAIKAALQADRAADARRLIHTCKGSAATLGLGAIQACAEQIEHAIAETPHDQGSIEPLLETLRQLQASLGTALGIDATRSD